MAAAKAAIQEAKMELDGIRRLQTTLDTARQHLQRAAERAHRLLAPRLEALMGDCRTVLSISKRYLEPERSWSPESLVRTRVSPARVAG